MRARGFTLLEMVVTVAVIAILAAMAVPMVRAATKNARVAGVGFDLQEKLRALATRAMRDQRELLAIVVDAVGNQPTNCVAMRDECAAIYVVETAPGFTLNAFNPSVTPWANVAGLVYYEHLGNGVKFYLPAAGRAAPEPFTGVNAFDARILGACGGGVRGCVGIRFRPDGSVVEERPDGSPAGTLIGAAFVIGSDVDRESLASDQRGIAVSFPSGIIRAFPVAR